MNFTPLKLFEFKPLGESASRKRGTLEIAIRSHRIDLSKSLFEAMGSPDKVQIGTSGNYLAVWGDPREGFQISSSRKSGAAINGKDNVIRLQSRMEQLKGVDFSTHFVVLSAPEVEGGKLIYNLEGMQVCLRQKRHQTKEA